MNNDLAFNDVDTLGNLLAQIAELTKRADKIKDEIKDGGKTVEGVMFKATYIEANRSSTDWLALVATKLGVEADWKKVAVKIGYEEQDVPKAIADNTKTTAVYSVKVAAR